MSDFGALKRQRATKNAKSFATPPVASYHDTEPLKEAASSDLAVSSDEMNLEEATKAVGSNASHALYAAVPPTLEIRAGKEKGRGLYSKYTRKPG